MLFRSIMEKDEETGETKVKEKVKGTVTGVDLTGATSVYVNGKKYDLSQVMAVGDVPEEKKEEDTTTSEDTEKNDTTKTRTI